MSAPIPCRWTGEAFAPLPRFAKQADTAFVVGEVYALIEHQERSSKTHSHFFACVAEAWKQLPESVAELYPSAEHLRKRALIEAGFYDEILIDAGSKAAALRIAQSVPMLDEFAICVVRGSFACIRRAKSMSHRAMDKQTFQDCKTKTLDVIAALIGVAPEELAKHSEAA